MNDLKNPYIPRAWRYFFYSLTRKCEADELRLKQVSAVFQERKSAIKIAAAHAEPIAISVEGDDGRQDDVQRANVDYFALLRFEETISVVFERGIGLHLTKSHGEFFSDDGRKNALFHPPCAIDERPGIDLLLGRQVTANACAAAKPGRPNDRVRDLSGCPIPFLRSDAGARRTHGAAHCRP